MKEVKENPVEIWTIVVITIVHFLFIKAIHERRLIIYCNLVQTSGFDYLNRKKLVNHKNKKIANNVKFEELNLKVVQDL